MRLPKIAPYWTWLTIVLSSFLAVSLHAEIKPTQAEVVSGSHVAPSNSATAITPAMVSANFSQQGSKLVGTSAVGNALQGQSVAVSADGNTAIVGGFRDNSNAGAAWVWTRSGGVWTQQGTKLVGSGAFGNAGQGISVAVSADGNTAIVGGFRDNSNAGAAWVWTRSGGVWTQQGTKLVGSGAFGKSRVSRFRPIESRP